MLLALHAKVGRWLQTGGHLEPGDADLASAARREAVEESGLAVVVDPVPLLLSEHPAPCRPDCRHLDVQFHAVAAPDPPTASAESTAVAWFAVDDLPDTDDTVRAVVAAARRRVHAHATRLDADSIAVSAPSHARGGGDPSTTRHSAE